jgi:hypothetical protein
MTDRGHGFQYERLLAREAADEAALWLASGRGILMMKAFMDDVRYELGGRRVLMTMLRSSGAEKREQVRTTFRRRVQVAPMREDGSPDWTQANVGVAQNLSSSGISVLQARLSNSERVFIGLESGGRPILIPAQVRHCRTVDEGMVELGCQFLPNAEPPPAATPAHVENAVGDLLENLDQRWTGCHERRAHPRAPYTERIEVRGRQSSEVQHAYARDLSKGGIAFIATTPVALEMKLLTLPQRGRPALRLKALVMRCVRISEGFYDVAAQFQDVESE